MVPLQILRPWDTRSVVLCASDDMLRLVGFLVPRNVHTGCVCRQHVMLAVDTVERMLLVQDAFSAASDGLARAADHTRPIDVDYVQNVANRCQSFPQDLCSEYIAIDYLWAVGLADMCLCPKDEARTPHWPSFCRTHPAFLSVLRAQVCVDTERILCDLVTHRFHHVANVVFGPSSGFQVAATGARAGRSRVRERDLSFDDDDDGGNEEEEARTPTSVTALVL